MSALLAPLLLSWFAAAVLLLFDGRRPRTGTVAAILLTIVFVLDLRLLFSLADGGAIEFVTGGWPRGVGIRLRADLISSIFATASAGVLAAVMLHEHIQTIRERAFPALLLFMSAGLHGLFFTGDAFNFYVFFELAMVASFVLAGYGHGRAELRATFTFMLVNLVGSVVFLAGVASLYHVAGTLDLAQLGMLAGARDEPALLLVAILLFSAFGLKLGLWPFHYWVPPVYRDTRPAVAAALAGALANIGSYGLLRFGMTVLPAELDRAEPALIVIGLASAIYGSLLALERRVPGEVLAYASVAQAGYMLVALGIGGPEGIAALLLLVIADAIDKATLFLALDAPGPAGRAAAIIGGTSLSGIPLTIGFIAKLQLYRAALAEPVSWAVLLALLAASSLGIAFLFRNWAAIPGGVTGPAHSNRRAGTVPFALAAAVLGLGFAAAPIIAIVRRAVGQLPLAP